MKMLFCLLLCLINLRGLYGYQSVPKQTRMPTQRSVPHVSYNIGYSAPVNVNRGYTNQPSRYSLQLKPSYSNFSNNGNLYTSFRNLQNVCPAPEEDKPIFDALLERIKEANNSGSKTIVIDRRYLEAFRYISLNNDSSFVIADVVLPTDSVKGDYYIKDLVVGAQDINTYGINPTEYCYFADEDVDFMITRAEKDREHAKEVEINIISDMDNPKIEDKEGLGCQLNFQREFMKQLDDLHRKLHEDKYLRKALRCIYIVYSKHMYGDDRYKNEYEAQIREILAQYKMINGRSLQLEEAATYFISVFEKESFKAYFADTISSYRSMLRRRLDGDGDGTIIEEEAQVLHDENGDTASSDAVVQSEENASPDAINQNEETNSSDVVDQTDENASTDAINRDEETTSSDVVDQNEDGSLEEQQIYEDAEQDQNVEEEQSLENSELNSVIGIDQSAPLDDSNSLITRTHDINVMYESLQSAIPLEREPTITSPSAELVLSKYYQIPDIIITLEEIRLLYVRLMDEVRSTPEIVPADISQNTDELITEFNNLKYFTRYFDIHKDRIESKRAFIESFLVKIGKTDREILNFYDLGDRYDDMLIEAVDRSQIFTEKDAELLKHTNEIANEISVLISEFQLLRDFEETIEQKLIPVRMTMENDEIIIVSRKMTEANEIMLKLVELKPQIFDTLNNARDEINGMKDQKPILDSEIEILLEIAEGKYKPEKVNSESADEPETSSLMKLMVSCVLIVSIYIGL